MLGDRGSSLWTRVGEINAMRPVLALLVAAATLTCVPSVSGAFGPMRLQLHDLAVFDANGKRIAKVLSIANGVAVVGGTVDERFIVLSVTADRFFGDVMIFEADDCTGAPFFVSLPNPFFVGITPPAGVGPPGSTVYVEDRAAVPQNIVPRSFLDSDGGCLTALGRAERVIAAVPLSPSIDLKTLFVPPFKVKEQLLVPAHVGADGPKGK
jgi:hypothetical protein